VAANVSAVRLGRESRRSGKSNALFSNGSGRDWATASSLVRDRAWAPVLDSCVSGTKVEAFCSALLRMGFEVIE
jgi:hypothetical protein